MAQTQTPCVKEGKNEVGVAWCLMLPAVAQGEPRGPAWVASSQSDLPNSAALSREVQGVGQTPDSSESLPP